MSDRTPSTSPSPSTQDLALLDAAINVVTRSRRMPREDVEDFRQTVHLKLIERGYDVFGRFDGRSSLRTYLVVVVRRLLLDWQNHHFGKWRPSSAATQMGPTAVRLDRLIDRDGYSADEAIACVRCAGEIRPVAELRRLTDALPPRRRRRLLPAAVTDHSQQVAFEDPVERQQAMRTAGLWHLALRREVGRLPEADRRLLALRFRDGITVRVMADRMKLDQKALYRRFDKLLVALRRQLPARDGRGATDDRRSNAVVAQKSSSQIGR